MIGRYKGCPEELAGRFDEGGKADRCQRRWAFTVGICCVNQVWLGIRLLANSPKIGLSSASY